MSTGSSSCISISHSASGAKAELYAFGATVTSFIAGNGRQVLFLSRDAKLDGSKAIRGGVPLVFPQFGQPDKSMPQHGFLRNNQWTVDESSKFDSEQAAGISLSLKLADVKNSRGEAGQSKCKWAEGTDLDCTVTMSLKIDASSLTQTLTIQNTATKPFDFQTLFHTYYNVNSHQALDKDQCNVKGLEGYHCSDKITGEEYTTGSDPIFIDRNIDHVYSPPDGKNVVDITVMTGADTTANLRAFGVLDGKDLPTSCVVWK